MLTWHQQTHKFVCVTIYGIYEYIYIKTYMRKYVRARTNITQMRSTCIQDVRKIYDVVLNPS
jgi:hypothetical protein